MQAAELGAASQLLAQTLYIWEKNLMHKILWTGPGSVLLYYCHQVATQESVCDWPHRGHLFCILRSWDPYLSELQHSEPLTEGIPLPMAGSYLTVALFVSLLPRAGTVIHRVAVSSDLRLCGFTCNKDGIYTLVGRVDILDYVCRDKSVHFNTLYESRLQMNVSAGCCIITNAQKSDTGKYLLQFQEFLKRKHLVQTTECFVIDPVSVTNISVRHNGENVSDSGETVSLSVSYSGEEATVVWAWNGGALPERHQLSDSNKTLTVPSTDTGTFTALVSNPVSHSSAQYNLTLPSKEAESQSYTGMIFGIISVLVVCVACGVVYWASKEGTD
eukprot:XP_004919289.1 PREDICTED: uncharacterized protein LOC105945139 [Xenopus tropicalis]